MNLFQIFWDFSSSFAKEGRELKTMLQLTKNNKMGKIEISNVSNMINYKLVESYRTTKKYNFFPVRKMNAVVMFDIWFCHFLDILFTKSS